MVLLGFGGRRERWAEWDLRDRERRKKRGRGER
jgi:hypothetical protein